MRFKIMSWIAKITEKVSGFRESNIISADLEE